MERQTQHVLAKRLQTVVHAQLYRDEISPSRHRAAQPAEWQTFKCKERDEIKTQIFGEARGPQQESAMEPASTLD